MARTSRAHAPALVLGLLMPALAGAAPRGAPPARPHRSAAPDVYAGYSFTQAGDANLHGFEIAGAQPWRRDLAIVAVLGGHAGSFAGADLSQLGLMAGARRTWRSVPLQPFLEALVGGARQGTTVEAGGVKTTDHSTSWGFALGGGASHQFSRRWAARAALHLRLLHGGGVWDKDPHFTIGAVYRLSR